MSNKYRNDDLKKQRHMGLNEQRTWENIKGCCVNLNFSVSKFIIVVAYPCIAFDFDIEGSDFGSKGRLLLLV